MKIELGEDGHSNRHGASVLPDTLRWLWRSQPVTVRKRRPERAVARSPCSSDGPRAAAAAAGRHGRRKPHRPRTRRRPRGAVCALVYRDKLWEQVGSTYESTASPARIRTATSSSLIRPAINL